MRRLRGTPRQKLYRPRSEENTLAARRDNNVGRKNVPQIRTHGRFQIPVWAWLLAATLRLSVLRGWSSGETSGNSVSKRLPLDWISMPEIPRMLNES